MIIREEMVMDHLEATFGDLAPRATGSTVRLLARHMGTSTHVAAASVTATYRAALTVTTAASDDATCAEIDRAVEAMAAIIANTPIAQFRAANAPQKEIQP